MSSVLSNLSNIAIPLIIFYVVAQGFASKTNVYENFITGAGEGFKIVLKIMPTLIGLMMAVGILRASGFFSFIGDLTGGMTDRMGFPSELIPLTVVKMFSSSAATGLVLDIFKEFGTDSYTGMITSVMMSCTETIFYTVSVYFMAAKVSKTGFTIPGALMCTLAGIIASVAVVSFMM